MKFILEQAKARKDIIKDINDAQNELKYHLIKLYLYRDNGSSKHWKSEIFGFINNISKLKNSNTYLDSKTIYNALFGNNEDVFFEHLPNYLDNVTNEYEDLDDIDVDDINVDKLFQFVKEYCEWLSTELSKNGSVRKADVFLKLDLLLLKYNN